MPFTNSVKLLLCELSQIQNKSQYSRKKALLCSKSIILFHLEISSISMKKF